MLHSVAALIDEQIYKSSNSCRHMLPIKGNLKYSVWHTPLELHCFVNTYRAGYFNLKAAIRETNHADTPKN